MTVGTSYCVASLAFLSCEFSNIESEELEPSLRQAIRHSKVTSVFW